MSYLGSMNAHSLGSQAVQLLPVQLGRPTVILLLGVLRANAGVSREIFQCASKKGGFSHLGVTVLASEEGEGLGIATQLHLAQLLPSPICVQICRSGQERCVW